MKKAEEIYMRMRAMYLRPHVTLPPVARRTKTTPTMMDYLNKVCVQTDAVYHQCIISIVLYPSPYSTYSIP